MLETNAISKNEMSPLHSRLPILSKKLNQSANFAPVWTTILKILAIFVNQTLTEHAIFAGYLSLVFR